MNKPYIIDETEDFAVVFKPAKMHTKPHQPTRTNDIKDTLLDWFAEKSSSVLDVMHRLDYETHGLVLIAKNEKSFNYFKDLQDQDKFVKEYSAICQGLDNATNSTPLSGFPSVPSASLRLCENKIKEYLPALPYVIESYFRPYGPGRKLVRPVVEDGKKHKEIAKDKGGFYKTEIIDISGLSSETSCCVFTVRIRRGFRHQIRCHLCWIGFPIQNDPLYFGTQQQPSAGTLALRAHALNFNDPATGKEREYRISSIN